ncbi:MAG: BlaI/MecI/CopY family transcriptional regulator [Oscillospiraceae bacterium]|nr:BlaI/MecI/CopY family transcriptional regulator [Oscillospiraceae bacterium]
MKLTENEISIMNLFWSSGVPLSAQDIVKQCEDKKWKASSINILLNSLLSKGAIEVTGLQRNGKHYSRTFINCISKEDYYVQTITDYVAVDNELIRKMTCALVQNETISDETILYLENLLNEAKKSRGLS